MTKAYGLIGFDEALRIQLVKGGETVEGMIVLSSMLDLIALGETTVKPHEWSGSVEVTELGYSVTIETGWTEEEERK